MNSVCAYVVIMIVIMSMLVAYGETDRDTRTHRERKREGKTDSITRARLLYGYACRLKGASMSCT